MYHSIGYTPSEAVRLLWGFARRNRHDTAKVKAVLANLEEPPEAADSGRSRMLALVEAGPQIVSQAMVDMGLSPDGTAASLPYDDLLAAAYLEKQAEASTR